jgi:hypothetical protein
VQDTLALDADEEKSIELKRELESGQERTVWSPTLSIPAKDFEFTDVEAARRRAHCAGPRRASRATCLGFDPFAFRKHSY